MAVFDKWVVLKIVEFVSSRLHHNVTNAKGCLATGPTWADSLITNLKAQLFLYRFMVVIN